ncbi:hypothetical protein PYCCODRAFT_1481812 [Trametes coccinea BRFM310]|uniref:Uncharacterized protein n=1 Tax=Trametes coccinea (strain BRFM310) TaxID=1353009 RepID=A0A1Y2I7U8_TRAC3|nr:hypothetical protein PYCCODRAFT_1481812 [Trametes coccinea BRFM310]
MPASVNLSAQARSREHHSPAATQMSTSMEGRPYHYPPAPHRDLVPLPSLTPVSTRSTFPDVESTNRIQVVQPHHMVNMIRFTMLGFATCAAFALLSPVLGLVMLPGDQALHRQFVTGTGVLAGFAGSALIGPLTGAALYGFHCWSQRSPLRTQRWNSSPKLLGQLSRFYTMFAILEMMVFSVVAYVVGLMLVKRQHPLPEGMDVGRAIVLFAVGYAALAPSLIFIFTVPVLLTRLWDWLHADEIQSEELFGGRQ